MAGNIQVSEGPTPFIRFAHTTVSDVAGFESAQFQIWPKTGSATRPIKVRYARSYLEARGYFDSQTGKLTVPVFGLYSGRPNRVIITLGFSGRFDHFRRFGIKITTPPYDGGTYSNPTVVQSRLPGTTLSYDFILLKAFAQNTTPIIIDSDAEIRWVGTAGVAAQNSILFDNAFYVTSGTSLLGTEFDGVTTPAADYSGSVSLASITTLTRAAEGMILDVDTVDQTESVNLEVDPAGNVLRTWKLGDIISAAMIAGGMIQAYSSIRRPPIGSTTTPPRTAALTTHSSFPVGKTLSSRLITTLETLSGFWAIRQSTGISIRRCANSPLASSQTHCRPSASMQSPCRATNYYSSMMVLAVISSSHLEKHATTAPRVSIRLISVLLRRLRPGIITLTRVSIARSAVAFTRCAG